jgi:hypothetical protein
MRFLLIFPEIRISAPPKNLFGFSTIYRFFTEFLRFVCAVPDFQKPQHGCSHVMHGGRHLTSSFIGQFPSLAGRMRVIFAQLKPSNGMMNGRLSFEKSFLSDLTVVSWF